MSLAILLTCDLNESHKLCWGFFKVKYRSFSNNILSQLRKGVFLMKVSQPLTRNTRARKLGMGILAATIMATGALAGTAPQAAAAVDTTAPYVSYVVDIPGKVGEPIKPQYLTISDQSAYTVTFKYMPSWLKYDANKKMLSGTPTEVDVWTPEVHVVDAYGNKTVRYFTVVAVPGGTTVTTTTPSTPKPSTPQVTTPTTPKAPTLPKSTFDWTLWGSIFGF